jgi:hypothetical protein
MGTNVHALSRETCPKYAQVARDVAQNGSRLSVTSFQSCFWEEIMLFRVLAASVVLLVVANSAHANVTIITLLKGANERPTPVSPAGTGFVSSEHDAVQGTLTFDVSFSGLTSNVTGAHIHCCATSVDTNADIAVDLAGHIPSGVTSGDFHFVLDMNDIGTFTPTFVTESGGTAIDAHSRLVGSMVRNTVPDNLGIAYLNIHTTMNPDGEIRGNFHLVPVPEPATFLMLLAGTVGTCGLRRRR